MTGGATPAFSVYFRDDTLRRLEIMSHYSRPRKVADADTLERAIQAADKFAERKMGRERSNQ